MKSVAGVACVLAALAATAQGAQRVESIAVGMNPVAAVVDPADGKLVVAQADARTGAGSITRMERDGRTTIIALPQAPTRMVLQSAMHRLLMLTPAGDQASILDLDAASTKTVRTGRGAVATVLSETATAFVLGAGANGDGSATIVDLRTAASRTVAWTGFRPEAGVATRDAAVLYMIGSAQGHASLQAFDVVAKRLSGDAAPLDMAPSDLAWSAGDIAVLGIAGTTAPHLALRLFDATLASWQSLDLGPTERGDIAPRLETDGQGRLWAMDPGAAKVWMIEPDAASVRAIDLESPPTAMAWNRVTSTLLVALRNGQAAVLSASGQRLDTLPLTRAATGDATMSISIDGASGDAYVLNAAEATVARLPREAGTDAPFNLTDLWLNPADPGWGVFIDQQGTTAFGTLFIHTARGDPTWLVMSNGMRQPDGSFSGLLYRTQGGGSRTGVVALPVGLMRITPSADGKASLTTVIDGLSQTQLMERFALGNAPRTCGWALAGDKAVTNATGLWSNPTDPGWGIAVAQRGTSAFAVLFTYDEQNRPTWMVMSNGRPTAKGTFTGDLYRASRTRVESRGTMTLRLQGAAEGSIGYRIDGTQFRSPVLRQSVGKLLSRCEP